MLSLYDKAALSLFRINPCKEEIEKVNNLLQEIGDDSDFGAYIVRLGIAPLLYHNKTKYIIPTNLLKTATSAYHQTLMRSMRLAAAFQEIAQICTAHGIQIIPLKGIYLSERLYKNIGLRLMSDIDIMIKSEDAQTCISLLKESGYKQLEEYNTDIETEIVHYEPLVKNGIPVEIHIKLHRIIESYNLNPALLWEHTISTQIQSFNVLALDEYDTLIFCCLHLDRHFQNKSIQFTGYVDMVNLISEATQSFSYNELILRCKLYNCESEVFKHLLIIHKYMDITLPKEFINEYKFVLQVSDERRFIDFLHGKTAFDSGIPRHISNLLFVKGFSNKLKYIIQSIFPPKAFIRFKYKLEPNSIVYGYYIRRFLTGLIGIFKFIKK